MKYNEADKILDEHKNDKSQLQVITSKNNKIMVVAPAGYGKTETMSSVIQYRIANENIPNYEKILCISFTKVAAKRMNKNIHNHINNKYIINTIETNNFHGLCERILNKYGYCLNNNLINLDHLNHIGINQIKNLDYQGLQSFNMSFQTKNTLLRLRSEIYNHDIGTIDNDFYNTIVKYNRILLKYIVPNGYILFDSIITLMIQLFIQKEQIREFYQEYYSDIYVDEFQDTNLCQYILLKLLIKSSNKIILFSDPIQSIFQFQGAIKNITNYVSDNDHFYNIKLKNNYRFRNNNNMILLDSNIRNYIRDIYLYKNNQINQIDYNYEQKSEINCIHGSDLKEEADKIINEIFDIIRIHKNANISLLFSKRSNSERILLYYLSNDLENLNNINMFNGLFKNDDYYFIQFQDDVCNIYQECFINKDISINRQNISNFIDKINTDDYLYYKEFIQLLKCLLLDAINRYFNDKDRNDYIISKLKTHSLKEYEMDIKSNIYINTIYGAKGLEWDYVFLPNFNLFEFNTDIRIDDSIKNRHFLKNQVNDIIKLMKIFYVGFTRAKRQIYFAYSDNRLTKNNRYSYYTYISGLASLPFIKLNKK